MSDGSHSDYVQYDRKTIRIIVTVQNDVKLVAWSRKVRVTGQHR